MTALGHGAQIQRARPDITRHHLGVAFKAAAAEDYRVCAKRQRFVARAGGAYAHHGAFIILDQALRGGVVLNHAALFLELGRQRFHQRETPAVRRHARLH